MRKAIIFEHVLPHGEVASGKSVAILAGKVCAIMSGGKLKEETDGGEDCYCSVFLDGGQEILVAGNAEKTSRMLDIDADI